MIIEACNSSIEEEIGVTDNCSGNVTVQVISADTLWMDSDGCVAGQLRTQTPRGWGATPNGNNPGAYLHAHFAQAFPNGITIGCGNNQLVFTSAQAVTTLVRTWIATDMCGHSSTFTQTVTVMCPPPVPAMPQAPPIDFDVFNSAGDEFVLRFVAQQDDRVTIKLVDNSGRETATLFSAAVGGGEEYLLRYPKQGLPGGIYLFVLSSDAGLTATDRELVP